MGIPELDYSVAAGDKTGLDGPSMEQLIEKMMFKRIAVNFPEYHSKPRMRYQEIGQESNSSVETSRYFVILTVKPSFRRYRLAKRATYCSGRESKTSSGCCLLIPSCFYARCLIKQLRNSDGGAMVRCCFFPDLSTLNAFLSACMLNEPKASRY